MGEKKENRAQISEFVEAQVFIKFLSINGSILNFTIQTENFCLKNNEWVRNFILEDSKECDIFYIEESKVKEFVEGKSNIIEKVKIKKDSSCLIYKGAVENSDDWGFLNYTFNTSECIDWNIVPKTINTDDDNDFPKKIPYIKPKKKGTAYEPATLKNNSLVISSVYKRNDGTYT